MNELHQANLECPHLALVLYGGRTPGKRPGTALMLIESYAGDTFLAKPMKPAGAIGGWITRTKHAHRYRRADIVKVFKSNPTPREIAYAKKALAPVEYPA